MATLSKRAITGTSFAGTKSRTAPVGWTGTVRRRTPLMAGFVDIDPHLDLFTAGDRDVAAGGGDDGGLATAGRAMISGQIDGDDQPLAFYMHLNVLHW